MAEPLTTTKVYGRRHTVAVVSPGALYQKNKVFTIRVMKHIKKIQVRSLKVRREGETGEYEDG